MVGSGHRLAIAGALSRVLIPAVIGLWLIAIIVGFLWAIDYDTRPGAAALPPKHWLKSSNIQRSQDGPTVLMFIHPQCPCSRASIAELAQVAERCGDSVSIRLVIVGPTGLDSPGLQSELRTATTIPSVTLFIDRDGVEARRFEAKTSGYTLAYDRAGQLVFSGGITAARGHYGSNVGSDALLTALQKGWHGDSPPVFGCALHSDSPTSTNVVQHAHE